MNAGDLVVKLEWDSRHFGFGVAKIPRARLTRKELHAARDFCREESIRCLYFLADSGDASVWRDAVETGFRPIDVRVDLDRREELPQARTVEEGPTDLATDADLPELLGLADSAFTESRFYRDENFPRARAKELFGLWTEKGVREPGFFTVFRRHGGMPAGFLTGRASGEGTGVIELVAVSDELRGKRIGTRLVADGLAEFRRRGCEVVSVATQGSNVSAQRLYQAQGFRTTSVRLWFHLWLE